MKCYLCKQKATIKQQKNRYICNKCFCRLIEKRVRKYTRVNKTFKAGDKLNVKGEIAKHLVKSITKKLPIKIGKTGTKIIEWTLDDEINDYLTYMLEGKKRQKVKGIKILKVITDKEAATYAKIKKLKFVPNKKNPKTQKMIEEIHKKYPNTKYTFLKNIIEIEQ